MQPLTDIILDYNFISEVDSKTFGDLVELKQLSISHNMITNLHPDTFADMFKIEKIYLSENSLIYVHPKLLTKNRHLQILNIANNRIKILPLDLFKYNNNLTEVYANGNEISFLTSQQFQHNPELKAVHLEENNIMFLHADTFSYSRVLLYVNLSHNKIHHLLSNTFHKNCHLKIVDLSNNNLETISVCQQHCLWEIMKIDISGNPLVCDSEMEEMSELCSNHSIHILGKCGSRTLRNSTRLPRDIKLLSEDTSGLPSSTELTSTEGTKTQSQVTGHEIPTCDSYIVSNDASVTVTTMNEYEMISTLLSDETDQNVTTVVTLVEYNSPLVVRESTVRGFLFIGTECLLACAFILRKLLRSKDQNDSTVASTIELLSESEPKSEGDNETEDDECEDVITIEDGEVCRNR